MSKIIHLIMLPMALIGVLLISACEISPKVIAICPKVTPLEEAAFLTRFLPGPGRDITDITLEAEFSRVAGECNVYDDKIEVGVFLELTATKGPALKGKDANASLFIFAMTADKTVLERREIPIVFQFAGNQSAIAYNERFLISIPKLEAQNGDDFLVYMAFKLTPEELRFNREEKSF